MHIIIPEDYQDCVRKLDCFTKLQPHEVTVYNDSCKDPEELVRRFATADALVLTRERTVLTEAMLRQLPRLKLISQIGKVAGHIDLDACRRLGIAVAQGSGSGAATAELTWALMLASRRHIVSESNRLRQGLWQGSLGQKLQGHRLGIWSYGRIGEQVARYGRAFGMHVWVWGRSGSTDKARADGFEVAPSRDDFFAQSDIVSLHIRLNEQTQGIIKKADLARMGPHALIVNTSRAELIEPGALQHALAAGAPGFAAVDVYEEEPAITSPLLAMPNVLCTPHLGYVERDNYESYFATAFDNINQFFLGEPTNLV
ncbi:MAG TPA: D-2-hydroxyacid dehydrogenase family protein [Advenella sp.]|nr:D-2-hydroxyacid dehydrogenase family protein [Advenella sp.]